MNRRSVGTRKMLMMMMTTLVVGMVGGATYFTTSATTVFTPTVDLLTTQGSTLPVSVVDMNRDGFMEIIVHGERTFTFSGAALTNQAAAPPQLSHRTQSSVADFNNDGYADVVACGQYGTSGQEQQEVRVGLGGSGATYGEPFQWFPIGYSMVDCAVRALDWDSDGWEDILVSGNDGSLSSRLFLNGGLGNGSTSMPVFTSFPVMEGFVESGMVPIRGEYGQPNVVLLSKSGARLIENTFGQAPESFAILNYEPVGSVVEGQSLQSQIAWGDFNQDGRTDYAVCSTAGVVVYLAYNGLFLPSVVGDVDPQSAPATKACVLAPIDVDKDGILDLALSGPLESSQNGQALKQSVVYWLKGAGDGSFTLPNSSSNKLYDHGSTSFSVRALLAADADNNGTPDLVAVLCDFVTVPGGGCAGVVLTRVSSGTVPSAGQFLGAPRMYQSPESTNLGLELQYLTNHQSVYVRWNVTSTSSSPPSFALVGGSLVNPVSPGKLLAPTGGQSGGIVNTYRFASLARVAAGSTVCVQVQAVSGDQVVQGTPEQLCVAVDGLVESFATAPLQSALLGDLLFDDWNNDQRLDYFVYGFGDAHTPKAAFLAQSATSAGRFVELLVSNVPVAPTARYAVHDLDHDGQLELLVCGATQRSLAVYTFDGLQLRNTTQLFVQPPSLAVPCGLGSLQTVDVDGDGWSDVVAMGADLPCTASIDAAGSLNTTLRSVACGASSVTVLRNVHGTLVSLGQAGLPSVALSSASWADLDGDGDVDAVLAGIREDLAGFRLEVFEQQHNFSFVSRGVLLQASGNHSSAWPALAVGDYNSDGLNDVLLVAPPSLPGVRLFRNHGGFLFGNVSVAPSFVGGGGQGGARLFDVDGDGRLDVLANGALESGVWLQRSDTFFARMNGTGASFAACRFCASTVLDLDLDGRYDWLYSGLTDVSPSSLSQGRSTPVYANSRVPQASSGTAPTTAPRFVLLGSRGVGRSSQSAGVQIEWDAPAGESPAVTYNVRLHREGDSAPVLLRMATVPGTADLPLRPGGGGNMQGARTFVAPFFNASSDLCAEFQVIRPDHSYSPFSPTQCLRTQFLGSSSSSTSSSSLSGESSSNGSAGIDGGSSATSDSGFPSWAAGVLAGSASGVAILLVLCMVCAFCVVVVCLVGVMAVGCFVVVAVLLVLSVVAAGALGLGGATSMWAVVKAKTAQLSLEEALEVAGNLHIHGKYRELAFGDLTFIEKVGEGAFGQVYRGRWKGAMVAIKTIDISTTNESAIEEARREAEIMTVLGNHPNIVTFVGAVTEGRQFCLVTEFCANGSLYDLVVKQRAEISDEDRLRMIRDAAAGLVYLHSMEVVHRDVAMRNCLLGDNMQVLISDFGTSRICQQATNENSTKSEVGPVRWMAPESIHMKQYSVKSDTWSFGVLIWEFLHRKLPYEGLSVFDVAVGVSRGTLRLPTQPDGFDPVFSEIMRGCFRHEPEERLSMEAVLDMLQGRMKNLGVVEDSRTTLRGERSPMSSPGNSSEPIAISGSSSLERLISSEYVDTGSVLHSSSQDLLHASSSLRTLPKLDPALATSDIELEDLQIANTLRASIESS